jgi:hypothetical protein
VFSTGGVDVERLSARFTTIGISHISRLGYSHSSISDALCYVFHANTIFLASNDSGEQSLTLIPKSPVESRLTAAVLSTKHTCNLVTGVYTQLNRIVVRGTT